jgi:hypothetical protein
MSDRIYRIAKKVPKVGDPERQKEIITWANKVTLRKISVHFLSIQETHENNFTFAKSLVKLCLKPTFTARPLKSKKPSFELQISSSNLAQ